MKSNKRGLLAVISLIAASITILGFITGWNTIRDVIQGLLTTSQYQGIYEKPTSIQLESYVAPTLTSSTTTTSSRWKSLGLIGEPTSDTAAYNETIYVATYGTRHGIFKSEDLGESWYAVNNGLTNFDILQVEVSPNNPNLVYAVDDGLWRSEDGGATWFRTEHGETCRNPRSVAIGSSNGQTLVLANCGDLSVSYDGGTNWEKFGSFSFGDKLYSAPSNMNFIYSLFRDAYDRPTSLIRRVIIGDDWRPLANVGAGLDVFDLSINHQDPLVLFAGTPSGVYKSEDGGGSWIPVNRTLPGQGIDLNCKSLQTSPWNKSEVFAVCNGNIYQSIDLGITWTSLECPEEVTLVHPIRDPHILLAATSDYGIWSYEFP